MRISEALAGAILAIGVGLAGSAFALDQRSISPDTPPADALRAGLNALKNGDTDSALAALGFAADKGLVSARWKLGEMYAAGEGVGRDEYKAYEEFRQIADDNPDVDPRDSAAAYVANAFVRLGDDYRTGIANSPLMADPVVARQYYTYAASYFADATAQLALARMYYDGEGGDRDPIQAARWANLSADKGNADAKTLLVTISLDLANKHLDGTPTPYDVREATQWAQRAADYGSVEGQALYGQLLFKGDGITTDHINGLMYLAIALARSDGDQTIADMQATARAQATAAEWTAAQQRAGEWLTKNPVTAIGSLTQ